MNAATARAWRGWLLLGGAVGGLLVAGCDKNTSVPKSASSREFPGYQQVGQSGEAAQFWFNNTDIQRKSGGYAIHALKVLPDGYARFDVLTNCRDTTRRLAGTEYDRNGTAKQDYAGNEAAVLAKSEGGMSELMGAACTVVLASRSIHGDFSIPAALELLYGPYDTQRNAAKWTDVAVPADLPWADNLAWSAGEPMTVTGVRAFDFTEAGKSKKLLVTKAVSEKGDCHACTGLLGVATFVREGENWKVESAEPYVASMGSSGSIGDRFSWLTAGDDSYALVVGGDDMHQGDMTATTNVFLRTAGGRLRQVLMDGDTGTSEQETLSVDTAFIKGKNTRHYDLKVSVSYNMAGQKTYVANHLYEFEDKKNAYVLVKKDDSPKFVQPADATAIAAATPSSPASAVSPLNTAASPTPTFGSCSGVTGCVARMLVAAKANDVLAASSAAAAISALPKPARGDRVKARKLNEEGLAALRANNSTEGVRLFTEAASADPGNEEVQSNLAYAYSLAGNYTQSVNVCKYSSCYQSSSDKRLGALGHDIHQDA